MFLFSDVVADWWTEYQSLKDFGSCTLLYLKIYTGYTSNLICYTFLFDTDGLRIEFQDGWGLIRPSNTSPCLTLRFEADDQAALERIQGDFRALLQATAAATGQSLSL